MVSSGPNNHVPSSICVDAAVGDASVANIGTPRLVALFRKVKSVTHITTRGLNCGYVDVVIALFMLGAAVGITMGGGYVV